MKVNGKPVPADRVGRDRPADHARRHVTSARRAERRPARDATRRCSPARAARPRGILVTGTEVLTGIITDRNGPWLSERLRELGVDAAMIQIVGDRPEDLLAALEYMARRPESP